MASEISNARECKVDLPKPLHAFLEYLTTLGIYGTTPAEAIRKLVEIAIEERIKAGTFTQAAAAIELINAKRASAVPIHRQGDHPARSRP